jgi:hypothetical protein
MTRRFILAAALCAAATAGALAGRQTPEADALRRTDPPQNGVWVDSLDMSAVRATVIRAPGRGGRGGAQPAAPPPAPVYAPIRMPCRCCPIAISRST